MMLQLILTDFDLDVFGACVNWYLPGGWEELPEQLTKYKFYFSFENSYHCRDYLTEKVWWNALRAGVVPVIWGPMRNDIEAVLPPGSFVFVEDFEGIDDLVQYLKKLAKNDFEYAKFFEWRRKEQRQTKQGASVQAHGFCQLCRLLHNDDLYEKNFGKRPKHNVESLLKWWYMTEQDECIEVRTGFEITRAFYTRRLILNEFWYKTYSHRNIYIPSYIILLLLIVYRRYHYRQ